MYGAGERHFLSTIDENNLPFDIFMAADTTVHGCNFIRHLVRCPLTVGGLEEMSWAVTSNVEFSVAGYIIHNPHQGIAPTQYKHFWHTKQKSSHTASNITASMRSLSTVTMLVLPPSSAHLMCPVGGWLVADAVPGLLS